MRRLVLTLSCLTLPSLLLACQSDDGNTDEVGDGETGQEGGDPCAPAAGSLDESACMAAPDDYVPGADDVYPACISDGAPPFPLFAAESPGAIARIEAFEQIAELLWENGEPTSEDFAMARTQYELDEGLASRVERRPDLHYPAIPMDEWDPGLDADKQCGNSTLAAAYPDYCAGPTKIRPLINQAFIDGIEGTGDPNVNAARIEAGILWFLYLSTYKEAFTCFQIDGEDCDASWAYFSGGGEAGSMLGLGRMVEEHSQNAASRVVDGVLAVRCVRDLYPQDMYPAGSDLPPDGQMLFDLGWEQLDQALHRSLAVVVRQHAAAQDSCGSASAANWELVTILGEVLLREAGERDAAAASELESIYDKDEPTPEDSARVIELLDQVFPCP